MRGCHGLAPARGAVASTTPSTSLQPHGRPGHTGSCPCCAGLKQIVIRRTSPRRVVRSPQTTLAARAKNLCAPACVGVPYTSPPRFDLCSRFRTDPDSAFMWMESQPARCVFLPTLRQIHRTAPQGRKRPNLATPRCVVERSLRLRERGSCTQGSLLQLQAADEADKRADAAFE